jgi:hypothetical protein
MVVTRARIRKVADDRLHIVPFRLADILCGFAAGRPGWPICRALSGDCVCRRYHYPNTTRGHQACRQKALCFHLGQHRVNVLEHLSCLLLRVTEHPKRTACIRVFRSHSICVKDQEFCTGLLSKIGLEEFQGCALQEHSTNFAWCSDRLCFQNLTIGLS